MCQLSFINLQNIELNKLYLLNQMLINTETTHKDGYGIFSENLTFKSEKTPNLVSNFGFVIGDRVIDNKPIASHVRLATNSWGKNLKEINKDNSHPFEYERIILAHNGTLEFNNNNLEKQWKDRINGKIDSEIFTMVLDDYYSKNLDKPFHEVFNDVVKDFSGKFAFIIFNKLESKWYIIRGWSAKLHISYIKEDENIIGYIINTEETSLEKNLKTSINIAQALLKKDLIYSKPELLEVETIYEAKETEVIKIAKTKENISSLAREITVYQSGYYNDTWHKSLASIATNEVDLLIKFLSRVGLSPEELNLLLLLSNGSSILGIDEGSLKDFEKEVMPIIISKTTENKKNIWDKISQINYGFITSVYNKYNLNFPYMYNTEEELNNVYENLKKSDGKL